MARQIVGGSGFIPGFNPAPSGPLTITAAAPKDKRKYTFEDAVAYIRARYPDAKPDERYLMATRHFYRMTGEGIPEWLQPKDDNFRQESDVRPLPQTDADRNRLPPSTDSLQGPPMSGEERARRAAIHEQTNNNRGAALSRMGVYEPYNLKGRVTSTDLRTGEKIPVWNRAGQARVFSGRPEPKPQKQMTWAEFFGKG